MEIQETARGHWPKILQTAGVNPAVLNGKHHPCPACGGTDRFRFDDQEGRGTFVCHHCTKNGAGDGFTLLQAVLSTDFKGAVAHVESCLGITPESNNKPAKEIPPRQTPPRPTKHSREGEPSQVWEYTDQRGRAVFWVYRFDNEDKKTYRPLHYSGSAWEWKDPKGKLPLYNLARIHAQPSAALLFCEGEKAADAASLYFPKHLPTTTAHGAQSPAKSDFSAIKGRAVLIWPDADAPGAKYADTLAELLQVAGAVQIEIIQLPQGLDKGADAADMAALGITPEQVQAWPRHAWKPAEATIVTTGSRLLQMSSDALQTLAARNTQPSLFVQNGKLVRLTHAKNTEGGQTLNLIPVEVQTLKHELERAIIWKRVNQRGEMVHTAPPDIVCNDILAMPDYDQFPRLARVVTAPCVNAAGHVIDSPGFDTASGIFYHQSEPLQIPDTKPTPAKVAAALSLIADTWLADFPFDLDCPVPHGATPTTSSSKANALALFLLPFARPLIDGTTPLHFITAPSQRTGKSLLVEVVCGVFDPLLSPGAAPEGKDNDAEWRKKITAMLQTESPFVWIDNVKGTVDTGALESALTGRYWSDRALGSNRQLTLKNEKVWVFTGNNAELSADIFGRSIEIRLDSNLENPSERTGFSIPDIRAWTKQHRGELCAAALVLIRHWLAQGKPEPTGTPLLGGFEAWRRVIGGILQAAGVQGFLANRQATKTRVNSTDDAFRVFIERWVEVYEKSKIPLSAKELHNLASEAGLFEDALTATNEQGEIKRLGKWLTKNQDRIFSGHKIKTGKTPSRGKNGYFLQSVRDETGYSLMFSKELTPKMGEIGEMGVTIDKGHNGFSQSSPLSPISPIVGAHLTTNVAESPENQINHIHYNGLPVFDEKTRLGEAAQDGDYSEVF